MAPEFGSKSFELPQARQKDLLRRLGLGDPVLGLKVNFGDLWGIGTRRESVLLVETGNIFRVEEQGEGDERKIIIRPASANVTRFMALADWDGIKGSNKTVSVRLELVEGSPRDCFLDLEVHRTKEGDGYKKVKCWNKGEFVSLGVGRRIEDLRGGIILISKGLDVLIVPINELYQHESGDSPIIEALRDEMSSKRTSASMSSLPDS